MKRVLASKLGWILVAWVVFIIFFPPKMSSHWSMDWGGHWHTVHAHRPSSVGGAERENWAWDYLVFGLEGALVALAVVAGLSAVPGGSEPGGKVSSRALARCAAVLHCGVLVLPLCSAGADTVWIWKNFQLVLPGLVVLWPNLIAFLRCLKIGRELRSSQKSRGGWVPALITVAAVLWTLFALIFSVPMFDLRGPQGGTMSAVLALWMTVIAIQRATEEDAALPETRPA
ncbi:MAG TPA: hypothetical protein VLE43_06595 [Candidatus Saccharimonadia bacterium]|nr:hypothetical protein [Candidatus Saccharimonadia bacterium]